MQQEKKEKKAKEDNKIKEMDRRKMGRDMANVC